ncbi:MAG TPA: hypothetical protein ENJ75_02240 [Candidatus Kaiserbacteria bacterium]|nr:hypothetical protein [Candidatus Kaiserbacteria bacterium]
MAINKASRAVIVVNNKQNMKNLKLSEKMNSVLVNARRAQVYLSKLDPKSKALLEKEWDVEHAYYSSALEGSMLDKREFGELAKEVK